MLSILISLELFIFPLFNVRDKLLSRTTIHFLSILNSVYSTRVSLRNYSRFLPVLIIALDYFIGKFLNANFYDSNCKYFDSMHSFIIIFVTIISFVVMTSNKEIKQYEKNGMIKYLHSGLANIVWVHKLFYYYKHFHLKHGNIVEFNLNLQLLINFLVDFFTNLSTFFMNSIICYKMTPKTLQTKNLIFNILKRFLLMVLANFVFYSIYSFGLARAVFEYVNETVPYPHNLIFYNILPKDLDQRFRIFLYIFNWLLS